MRIIPVIDLFDGIVVHAVSGEREKYEPIDSMLTDSANPVDVASKFEKLGFKELYIADLNAILKEKKSNRGIIEKITTDTGLSVILDGGFEISNQIEPYIESGIEKIVLATETLASFEEVKKTVEEYSLPVIGSIDMKGGEIMANSLRGELSLSRVLRGFEENNTSELILLNLEKVGSYSGPDEKSLRRAVSTVDIPILVGGGIRNIDDLKKVKEIGAQGALVATALHNGSIEYDQVHEL
ncbi:hypothetical protein AKJ65_03770 [candidate division MSBL1 archaeon SCGC-AAA259E19]|uniref:Phosphoribosylformimino-5-aminoimidazole carboxamide ribotide isomerase n=2 Tax=candidate division MSBL1 TaxID=215777 RepID=A0A133UKD8_9EURY|nr:hypothetical protein AKJ65_03770 [candidate division MSBL1 archaeon SCGC-AAA259E19]